MTEINTKKILFNKSSLISLKAELLKKREEVYEKKQQPQHKVENFKPVKSSEKIVDKTQKISFKDRLQEIDTEELEACRKAKCALEKKTELYNHLSDGSGNSQLVSRFLVDFSNKKQEVESQEVNCPVLDHDEHQEEEEEAYEDDASEWTEFTDCLGRTRKCLKSDLEFYQKKDNQLKKIIKRDEEISSSEPISTEEPKEVAETPLLVQKTNDYLQSLREKWEQKERELLAKDKDIHYQDVLFDEARMHGVGYYSFSTEETERRKQMEELMRTRQETLKAQQETEQARKKREELIATRVASAKARRRLRAGLPPEDPEEKQEEFTKCLLAFLTEQKNEAEAKAKAEQQKIREEQEKERQKLRESYIREWDVGKEGVDDKKKFREMTQEEYVEQQRSKRIDEFAPPKDRISKTTTSIFDTKGIVISTGREPFIPKTSTDVRFKPKTPPPSDQGFITERREPFKPKTWDDVRSKVKTPPPPDISDVTESKGLYFSTNKKHDFGIKYKNFIKPQESVPIQNELSDDDNSHEVRAEKRSATTTSTEIAPPLTYDYYGPIPKHLKTKKPFESDIREAYAQGSKSLEYRESNRQLSKDYDFTFD